MGLLSPARRQPIRSQSKKRCNNQYQLEWKTIKIKLSEPVKKTKSNGQLSFRTMQSQPDEHHRDLSLKKWGASNKVLVVRPAAIPIGLFLLLYDSLSFFDGITLSLNAATNSTTIKEEATTNINRNGTVATTKRVILKKSRCGAK
jgi:hypothetical protein